MQRAVLFDLHQRSILTRLDATHIEFLRNIRTTAHEVVETSQALRSDSQFPGAFIVLPIR